MIHAAWIGLGGGLLVGLAEALGIVARNAAGAASAFPGVGAAAGFVVALDGGLGALLMAALGWALSVVPVARRRFESPGAWSTLCTGVFVGGLILVLGLDGFGVLAGTVRGARAAVFAAASLGLGALAGTAAGWLAQSVFGSASAGIARLARRAAAGVFGLALLLPLAFAVFGRGR
jgi:hypothetical protein